MLIFYRESKAGELCIATFKSKAEYKKWREKNSKYIIVGYQNSKKPICA